MEADGAKRGRGRPRGNVKISPEERIEWRREYQREYRKAHPGRNAQYEAERRARMKQAKLADEKVAAE